MDSDASDLHRKWQRTSGTRSAFWMVVVLLVTTAVLHYLTPQTRLFPLGVKTFLTRHAVERIIFVLPVAVATAAFRQKGGIITLILVVLIMLPRAIWLSMSPQDALVETAAAAVLGTLVIWMIEAQAREKSLHQQLAAENARLYESMRFYIRGITRAQEDERQRIARELHDETIQMLIVLSRRIEAVMSLELRPEIKEQLKSLQGLIRDISGGIRRFVRDLRPPTLDDLGLVSAIRGIASDLTKRDGIETELVVTGEERRLAPEEELTLFRITQEALNNVRWHSGASRVLVQLAFHPGKVQVIVDDNGRGFDAPERMDDLVSTGRLGLVGMDERARILGGTLAIHSEPGRGTGVIVDVPVQLRSANTTGDD
ncbi:MAG: sensor histidine kinase [Anaerolineae bacterium]|nr:sensor histidine kinase [Anaerolineae bacterium]